MMAVYRLLPGLPSAWLAIQREKGHPGLKGQQPKIVYWPFHYIHGVQSVQYVRRLKELFEFCLKSVAFYAGEGEREVDWERYIGEG
jgi:hypothetical protein